MPCSAPTKGSGTMSSFKRILAVFAALVLCVSTFAGCGGSSKDAAISMEGGGDVSISFMYLLAAIQKSMYASVAEAGGGDWNMVVNAEKGTTLSDLLYDVTVRSAESSLVCEYLHDKVYKLTLTDEQKQSVDKQMTALADKAGSQKALEEELSKYSADSKTMRRYLELTVKQANLYNYFYGENGIYAIPEENIKADFAENYHIVTHIYFNLASKGKEDGTLVSLTDEEIAAKRLLAEEVYNRILAGEDFYTLKAEYSEDSYESEYYPNGFFVTGDTTFPTEFTTAAMDMKVGEYRLTETGGTGTPGLHILYKLPMDADLYNTDKTVYSNIKSKLITADFDVHLSEYTDKLKINEEKLALLNVAVVPEYAY